MASSYWLKFGNAALGYNGSGLQSTGGFGSITVSVSSSGNYFDQSKSFSITAAFGEAISYKVDGIPVATPSATCTLSLKPGESSVISGIPEGTTYSISEDELSQLDTHSGYRGTAGTASGTMGAEENVVYGATYSRTPYRSYFNFKRSQQAADASAYYTASFFELDGTTPVALYIYDPIGNAPQTSVSLRLTSPGTTGFGMVMNGTNVIVKITCRYSYDLYAFNGPITLVDGPKTTLTFRVSYAGRQYIGETRLDSGAYVCDSSSWY